MLFGTERRGQGAAVRTVSPLHLLKVLEGPPDTARTPKHRCPVIASPGNDLGVVPGPYYGIEKTILNIIEMELVKWIISPQNTAWIPPTHRVKVTSSGAETSARALGPPGACVRPSTPAELQPEHRPRRGWPPGPLTRPARLGQHHGVAPAFLAGSRGPATHLCPAPLTPTSPSAPGALAPASLGSQLPPGKRPACLSVTWTSSPAADCCPAPVPPSSPVSLHPAVRLQAAHGTPEGEVLGPQRGTRDCFRKEEQARPTTVCPRSGLVHRPCMSFTNQCLPPHKTHFAPRCPGGGVPQSHPVTRPAGSLPVSLAAATKTRNVTRSAWRAGAQDHSQHPVSGSRAGKGRTRILQTRLGFPAHTWNEGHGQPPSRATPRPRAALPSWALWASWGAGGPSVGRGSGPGMGWDAGPAPRAAQLHPCWLGTEDRRGASPQHLRGFRV